MELFILCKRPASSYLSKIRIYFNVSLYTLSSNLYIYRALKDYAGSIIPSPDRSELSAAERIRANTDDPLCIIVAAIIYLG
jgi:hypothetical protein